MPEDHRFDSPEFLTRLRESENEAWKILTSAMRTMEGKAWDALVYLLAEGYDKKWEALEKGQEKAWDALNDVMWRPLTTHLCQFLREMTDPQGRAEDLAQETFLSVFLNIRQFRGDARFTTWVYQIAANKAKDYIRERLPLLKADDVNWSFFSSRLSQQAREAPPSPGKRIWCFLPSCTRDIVTAIAQTQKITRNQKSEVFKAIREILKRRDFYEESSFSDVALADNTKTRLSRRQHLSDITVERCNHNLFRDSFSECVVKTQGGFITISDLTDDPKRAEDILGPDKNPQPDAVSLQREIEEVIKRWVKALPPVDWLHWKLRYDADDLTEREIADLLDVPEELVRARLLRLGKNLQKDDLTEREIADLLGLAEGTVSARLWQLRRDVLEYTRPYLNEINHYEWQGMQVVPDGPGRVVVKAIRAGSVAMKAGIEIGDPIPMIGSMPVHNITMFAVLTNRMVTPGDETITVIRDHEQKKITLRCTGRNGRGSV